MNLNQSAHGDREFGFIGAHMRLKRKVVVGFWQDDDGYSVNGYGVGDLAERVREVADSEVDHLTATYDELGYATWFNRPAE